MFLQLPAFAQFHLHRRARRTVFLLVVAGFGIGELQRLAVGPADRGRQQFVEPAGLLRAQVRAEMRPQLSGLRLLDQREAVESPGERRQHRRAIEPRELQLRPRGGEQIGAGDELLHLVVQLRQLEPALREGIRERASGCRRLDVALVLLADDEPEATHLADGRHALVQAVEDVVGRGRDVLREELLEPRLLHGRRQGQQGHPARPSVHLADRRGHEQRRCDDALPHQRAGPALGQ